jgi:hypothetical protein
MHELKQLIYLVSLLSLLWSANCVASDGVLEINQACAVNGGCFDGDTAGFPVTITQSGSYRLTGNLTLTSDTDAILISSSYVTLDLNGFEIAGSSNCTGTGATLSCDGGSGSGVFATPSPTGITIRNGTIRNHGFLGIQGEGDGHRVQDVLVRHNGSHGIAIEFDAICHRCSAIQNGLDGFRVNQGTVITNSVANGNGRDGIVFLGPGGTVMGSTSRGNGNQGFNLEALSKFGHDNVSTNNAQADDCGGGICTTQRRYYLTRSFLDGDEAPGACLTGFHMTSIFEIKDTTVLAYDTTLGATLDDSGSGPPSVLEGWVRQGFASTNVNCEAYTSDSADDNSGSLARLVGDGEYGSSSALSPWLIGADPCSTTRRVWCIED